MFVSFPAIGATYTVTTNADAGAGSFRQAILDANASSGLDTIQFDIASGGPQIVGLAGPLPHLTDAVVIDGTTQPGFAGTPIITIDGNDHLHGLTINSATASTIRGLVLVDFGAAAINVLGGGATIVGNYIGVNASGMTGEGNDGGGIFVDGSVDGVIIGGATSTDRNVISANRWHGIVFGDAASGALSDNNILQGNIIGLDAAGLNDLGNTGSGVRIEGGDGIQIGGTAPGTRNVISGNGLWGVVISAAFVVNRLDYAVATTVQGNFIGTNGTGTAAIPNFADGILLSGTTSTVIGGATAGARNIISGNGGHGIALSGLPPVGGDWDNNTVIAGNFIGTDVTGTVALGNSFSGVELRGATLTTIGGASAAAGNVISGNGRDGITFEVGVAGGRPKETVNSMISNNRIGTDVTGMVAVPNARNGIAVSAAYSSIIGGLPGGNLISGNAQNGIAFLDDEPSPLAFLDDLVPPGRPIASTSFNVVQGNRIGTDVSGTTALPNGRAGVLIGTNPTRKTIDRNVIGGTDPGQENRIWFNGSDGIEVVSGVANRLFGNSIDLNGDLGIDLAGDGMTANDVEDPDAGPNNRQNYPVLTAAVVAASTSVSGTLSSTPSRTFRIEFFSSPAADPSGFAEGRTFLGFTEVATDAFGNAAFSAAIAPLAVGSFVTATATDLTSLDTSEFSNASAAVNAAFIPTLSEWALLLMAVMLGVSGVMAMRS